MREIPLTQNKVALVDDEYYEYLSQWKWYTLKAANTYYAVRWKWKEERSSGKTGLFMMHRVIAERVGIDITNFIDHIDRNGLNNQRENLRPATHKQNLENMSIRKDNTSGYRGVTWCKGHKKWRAEIWHNGKAIRLGRYQDKEDAITARKEAEKKYFTHAT